MMESLLDKYDRLQDKINFIIKSDVRLKIITYLYKQKATIKQINNDTGLNYTSITTNIKKLEEKGLINKDDDKYMLNNTLRMNLLNILYLTNNINYLNDMDLFINMHLINTNSHLVSHLPYLKEYEHIKTDNIDPYKITNIMEKAMMKEEKVRTICIYLHPNCSQMIKIMMEQKSDFHVIVPTYLARYIIEHANNYRTDKKIKNKEFLIKPINSMTLNLSLVITEDEVILALVQGYGKLDKNHCLISKDLNTIQWAYNLYEEYEKKKAGIIDIHKLVCANNKQEAD